MNYSISCFFAYLTSVHMSQSASKVYSIRLFSFTSISDIHCFITFFMISSPYNMISYFISFLNHFLIVSCIYLPQYHYALWPYYQKGVFYSYGYRNLYCTNPFGKRYFFTHPGNENLS